MKHVVITIVGLCLLGQANAQLQLGPRVGLGTEWTTLSGTTDNIEEGDAEYTYHIGAFLRLGGEQTSFYLQPEILWSSSTVNINFRDDNAVNIGDMVLESKLNKLDVPFMLGIRAGSILSLQFGPVATFLTNEDVSAGIGDAMANYKDFTFGFQAGLGIDIGNIYFDIRYEGKASDISDRININGVTLDQRSAALKASASIRLF